MVAAAYTQAAHGLVRRALAAASEMKAPGEKGWPTIKPWAMTTIVMTSVTMFIGLVLLEYVLWRVIGTLALVETPVATPSIRLDPKPYSDESNSDKTLEAAPLLEEAETEIPTGSPVYITSSIRGALGTLRRSSGIIRGFFRGLRFHLLHAILFSILVAVLAPPVMPFSILVTFFVAVALSPIHAAATHAVIAGKATLTPAAVWKHLWLPTLMRSLAEHVAAAVCLGAFFALGLHHVDLVAATKGSCATRAALVAKLAALPAVALLTGLLVLLPAIAVLIRVEASLLPASAETVVPVDRTFGGRAVPAGVKNDESRTVVRFAAACRSFTRDVWFRLVCLGAKLLAVDLVFNTVAVAVIMAVTYTVAGDAIRELYTHARPGRWNNL